MKKDSAYGQQLSLFQNELNKYQRTNHVLARAVLDQDNRGVQLQSMLDELIDNKPDDAQYDLIALTERLKSVEDTAALMREKVGLEDRVKKLEVMIQRLPSQASGGNTPPTLIRRNKRAAQGAGTAWEIYDRLAQQTLWYAGSMDAALQKCAEASRFVVEVQHD